MLRIPLLKDNHNHFFSYGSLATAVNLFYVRTEKEAINLLVNLPKDKINVATGWFDSYFTFTSANLENLPPIIICNNSLHNYIFNKRAGEFINQHYAEWYANCNNQDWLERNTMQVLSFIASLTGFSEDIFANNISKNLQRGIAFASDMFLLDDGIFDFLVKHDCSKVTEVWTSPGKFPSLSPEAKNICAGVKLFADGACGASTAAISEYKNDGKPFITYTDNELTEMLERLVTYQTGIAIHCIGENAIEQVLNCLSSVLRHSPDRYVRLEHVQFITAQQAKKARDLNLTLSMQPNFSMDSIDYADRLTNEYCRRNNPFRMIIDKAGFVAGKNLILGSDGMPAGIEGALGASLFPPVEGQRLTLEEFVAGYCVEDFEKGYIEVEIEKNKQRVNSRVVYL